MKKHIIFATLISAFITFPLGWFLGDSFGVAFISQKKNLISPLIDQIKEIEISELLPFLSDLNGIERRMDIYKIDDKIIIDDYAHHPTEIESVFDTINSNYKNKSTSVIFLPTRSLAAPW